MCLSNPPSRDQLQELMLLPHGDANSVLIKNGFWNYLADPNYSKYLVSVYGEIYDHELEEMVDIDGWTTVYATDPSRATNMAVDLCTKDIEWDFITLDQTIDDVFPDWEINEVKPIPHEEETFP